MRNNNQQEQCCVSDGTVYEALAKARNVLAARLNLHLKQGERDWAEAELGVLNGIQRSMDFHIINSQQSRNTNGQSFRLKREAKAK